MPRSKNYQQLGLILITIGVFFFPRSIRLGLTGQSIGALNILPFIGSILIIVYKNRIKYQVYLIMAFLYILMFITEYCNGLAKFSMMITLFVNLLMPLLIIGIDEYYDAASTVKKLINIINVSMTLTIIAGIIDILANRFIGRYIAAFSKDTFFILLANGSGKRLFTWFGHYIYTGELFLLYYLLNVLYNREVLNIRESNRIFIISLIGILLVGSKTCTALILIVYIAINLKKIQSMIAGICIVLSCYIFGVFDLLISRIDPTDISTGRSASLKYLFTTGVDLFPLFIGHGTNFITILREYYSNASVGLEYVFFMFTSYFGVLFTIILYSVCFLKPIIIFKKSKKTTFLICFIAFAIDVNTYNGLAVFQDQMWAFCIGTGIMLLMHQLSNQRKQETLKE